MIKRPLSPQFSDPVKQGRKTTTIRKSAWPVGVPIMLYNWSGAAYRSRQNDVAEILVESVRQIKITHREDGGMIFAFGFLEERRLWETEGFASRAELDAWFRAKIKPGKTIQMHLMTFGLARRG